MGRLGVPVTGEGFELLLFGIRPGVQAMEGLNLGRLVRLTEPMNHSKWSTGSSVWPTFDGACTVTPALRIQLNR